MSVLGRIMFLGFRKLVITTSAAVTSQLVDAPALKYAA
jgi:hypothetical protein